MQLHNPHGHLWLDLHAAPNRTQHPGAPFHPTRSAVHELSWQPRRGGTQEWSQRWHGATPTRGELGHPPDHAGQGQAQHREAPRQPCPPCRAQPRLCCQHTARWRIPRALRRDAARAAWHSRSEGSGDRAPVPVLPRFPGGPAMLGASGCPSSPARRALISVGQRARGKRGLLPARGDANRAPAAVCLSGGSLSPFPPGAAVQQPPHPCPGPRCSAVPEQQHRHLPARSDAHTVPFAAVGSTGFAAPRLLGTPLPSSLGSAARGAAA